MSIGGELGVSGDLQARLIKLKKAPVSWKLRNNLRWSFIKGWIAAKLVAPFANFWGVCTIMGELHIKVRRLEHPDYISIYRELGERLRLANSDHERSALSAAMDKFLVNYGVWTNYGVVSHRVITDAGVAFLVDDWDNNGQDQTTMNFHGCGTGAGAEAVGNTALTTESTTALVPDSTRATGTRSQPTANQYRSVGTLTFDADAAIIEHGLFSASGTGTGTLWDRSTFAAINVVGANGDSIQFTYTATISSGG